MKNSDLSIQLEYRSWPEVEAYLKRARGIILPTGSVEQHGPIGLIGTDAICAREVSWAAAHLVGGLVAPALTYAPAPFNMQFPGTVSIRDEVYEVFAQDVLTSLASHGFSKIYVLNGHGANLAPLKRAAAQISDAEVRIRSWWDYEPVNALRETLYGDWEGMHGTPSEVAITQATHRVIPADGLAPPRKLSAVYIREHAGDKHGPPDQHRQDFPDGRVGSHSGLATKAGGERILATAAQAVAEDYTSFLKGP